MDRLTGIATGFAILLASSAAHAQTANDHVYTSNLTTRWGKTVTPDNAWRSYPRPQMKRDRWQNLNGLWDYAIAPKAAPQPARMDGQILVPFPVESKLSRVARKVTPDDRIWYRRSFTVPATPRAAGAGSRWSKNPPARPPWQAGNGAGKP